MKQLRLYPPVEITGQDFTKVKSHFLPNQSLTLKDIIKRFIRKESLPIGRDGVYNENLGDIEKMAREDITVQQERAAVWKARATSIKNKLEEQSKPPTPAPTPAPAPTSVPPPVSTPPTGTTTP